MITGNWFFICLTVHPASQILHRHRAVRSPIGPRGVHQPSYSALSIRHGRRLYDEGAHARLLGRMVHCPAKFRTRDAG